MRRALGIALLVLAATPGAADAKSGSDRYRVAMDIAGTWTESVRAADAQDPIVKVATRDSQAHFTLRAAMPRVAFRAGRVVTPVYDVAGGSLVADQSSSTYTNLDEGGGTCSVTTGAATGGGELAMAGGRIVFRSSSDAPLDWTCVEPFARWSFTVDFLRVAGSSAVAPLGTSPIDVAFTIPKRRIGAKRIVIPVAASAAQRSFARCPREYVDATVACTFAWTGTVTLDRVGR
jgi:hypothetical protein